MDHEHVFAHRVNIGGRWIGRSEPPFVIAEMSGNHNQSLDRALQIVEAAAEAGAHALKLQTYTPDTMTINLDQGEFRIEDPGSLWKGKSLYDLYREAYTPWEWHEAIFKRGHELGLVVFSTPFDATAVKFLEELGAPAYKIASFENADLPLIRTVAATGKPMFISTGMATIAELDETVRAARGSGCRDIVLLKCTSSYPASPENTNIRTIPHMRELFDVQVGLSDHTLGVGVAVAAVGLGATVVEKHFTLSRDVPGPDSAFSLEPHEFKAMVEGIRTAEKALGEVRYEVGKQEAKSRVFRRSLFVVKDMKAGEVFTHENVRSIRPGYGLPPKFLKEVLGRRAACDIKSGTPLEWRMVR